MVEVVEEQTIPMEQVFNIWRNRYDYALYQEQESFYDMIYDHFPYQLQYNYQAIKTFLFTLHDRALSILEIGGWHGEMAFAMLNQFSNIVFWNNIEICKKARALPVGQDPRYLSPELKDFAWNFNLDRHYDLFIASHLIEHLKKSDLEKLLNVVDSIECLYFDSPLPKETKSINWSNYPGSHIIEVGWNELSGIVKGHGYQSIVEDGSVYIFKKGEMNQ